jgi:PhnB protein
MSHKPDGYTSVAPYLICAGAAGVVEFLRQTFAAEPLRRFDSPDGKVHHAELRVEDTVVMLADAHPDHPPAPAHVHVYVADVDAIYRKALAAGGESVQEPAQRGDPDRRAGVKDPAGNTWWIATQVG